MGETRFESQDYQRAIIAYENAAYGSYGGESTTAEQGFQKHNEAAYAALLAYDQLISTVTATQQIEDWQAAKNDSALLFANTFKADPRSNTVLTQTIQSLLNLKSYKKTITVGQAFVDRLDSMDKSMTTQEGLEKQKHNVIAGLSIAHAQRELSQFTLAEQSYEKVLLVLNESADSALYQNYYAATLDNYAASIYQQGVNQIAANNNTAAANHFMRVVSLAPASKIRVSAQRDAITLFIQTQQWQRGIAVMSDFQQRFANNPAAQAIPAQLLLAYQSLEDWSGAAAQAKAIAINDPNPQVQQQALYSAAEFYQQAGDIENAIDSYRSYAHSYTEPLAENMEAQYRLSELYAGKAASDKRAYWLRKLMLTHKNTLAATERSRYLAAFAAINLAENTLHGFQLVSLEHPLKKSLVRKRKAMQVALTAYQKALAYDVELFSTQATYRIADIYASFAKELLNSERPAGLSALELEQYDFLLEEQAYPFEEKAIDFYTINIERSWQGIDSEWIRSSYQALAELIPAKYDKREMLPERI